MRNGIGKRLLIFACLCMMLVACGENPGPGPIPPISTALNLYMNTVEDFASNREIAATNLATNPKKRIKAEVQKDIAVTDSTKAEKIVYWCDLANSNDSISTDWKGNGITTGPTDTLILNPERYALMYDKKTGKLPEIKSLVYERNMADSTKMVVLGANPIFIKIKGSQPVQVPEVEILGPNDFADKAQQIAKFLSDGCNNVRAIMRSNVPATAAVMNILNQKTITGGNVTWADTGAGAFVPATANQEIDGNIFANLPIGNDGDKRFYIKNAYLVGEKNLRGLANRDTTWTSKFSSGPDVQKIGWRGQKIIFVDTDYAVDAGNFSGYERTNDKAKNIPVIVQNGKQLVLENATAVILSYFQTKEVQEAYNYGNTRSKDYIWNPFPTKWLNMDFGPNGPLQLVVPNTPISNPNISWDGFLNYPGDFYDDPVIKSMHIGKDDIIYEAGHFVNGKDVSNSVLNMLEHSRLNQGPINFTIEGKEIDIRWTQLQQCQMAWGNDKVLYFYLDYLAWLSSDLFELKKNNLTFKVGNDVVIISPRDAPLVNYKFNNGNPSWNVSQDAPKYMLNDYNIVLDHKPELRIGLLDALLGPALGGYARPPMKLTGGWGQEWWNVLRYR